MNLAISIYTLLVFVFNGGLGLMWKSDSGLNLLCKLTCILSAFCAIVVLVKGIAMMPFLIVSGLVCLVAAMIWSTNGALNRTIKGIFSAMAIGGGILVFTHL